MTKGLSRRRLLQGAAAGLAAGVLPTSRSALAHEWKPPADAGAIASANGVETVRMAHELVTVQKLRPVSAAVRGVAVVEADPNDMSVGYGGLPDEDGKVSLDSAVMDGPTHNAGSVGAIQDIMHPAQVAERVMDATDHVNLVGAGARRFALEQGFQPENLLTERAEEIWKRWIAGRDGDDRLWPLNDTDPADPVLQGEPRPWGTIHCSVLAPNGDLGCCTTTSGLAFKVPGRIGDSPLIGCGLYCDNEVGSAGATGRGEAAILSGGSWLIVEKMREGMGPTEACLEALRRVVQQTERAARWQPALWKDGRPSFGLTFYAVRKDGEFGSATMSGRRQFAVATADGGARREPCATLYS
ncbi:MAG: N(4)-(beta-N-acetylglucosaminyl)-L-asparaginase [Planctomycetes bacterium]|nr:N(4)-(beta-N-acetylglucosaminyl)-L-asparaginase [Planctomycetota bacterium]